MQTSRSLTIVQGKKKLDQKETRSFWGVWLKSSRKRALNLAGRKSWVFADSKLELLDFIASVFNVKSAVKRAFMSVLKVLDSEIKATLPSNILRTTNCVVFLLLLGVNVITQTSILGRSDLEISASFPNPSQPLHRAYLLACIWSSYRVVKICYG